MVTFEVRFVAYGLDAYLFHMRFGYSGRTLLLVACNSAVEAPKILALAQGDGILGTRDATLAVLCKSFRRERYSPHNLVVVVESLHFGT